jgi:hypothetical protein
MFGPAHPRKQGRDGLVSLPDSLDTSLPGFGPFGPAGQHCFDKANPVYRRIAAACEARKRYPVLRCGRQYLRPVAESGTENFRDAGAGELAAWSRVLDDEEALCVVNANGREERGARVLVDADLNPPDGSMIVVLNTAQAAGGGGSHQVGETLPVKRTAGGTAYVEIHRLPACEALVLMNHA